MEEKKTRSKKLLIKKEEMILIKNSETAKDIEIYGNLFAAIELYDKLSEQEFYENKILDERARSVILNNKGILIDSIIKEWFAVSYMDEATKEVRCQLCGRKNKWIFYIKNRNNENELNVGSDCIKKFPNIENMSGIIRDRNKALKERNTQKRRIEFEQRLEFGDSTYIKDIEKKFNNIDILLPKSLYDAISRKIYNLNFLKTTYIKEGGDLDDVVLKYNDLKKEFNDLWEQATDYYEDNKGNKLLCHKYIADWLHNLYPEIWERISINNGFFDKDTLKYAYNNKFMQKHFKYFRKCLSDKDIKIVSVDITRIKFYIKNLDYIYPVFFSMSNKKFMESIGNNCIIENNFKFTKSDFCEISVDRSDKNFEAIYNRIVGIISKIGYEIEIDSNTNTKYYKRLSREIKRRGLKKQFVEVGYKKMADDYLFGICDSNLFASDSILEKIFNNMFNVWKVRNDWITQEEKDKYTRITAEVSMQKQREFIPY